MDFSALLNNLRILGSLKDNEYISTKFNHDINYTYPNTYWDNFNNFVETWGCTHLALKKVFVSDVPKYISHIMLVTGDDKYKKNLLEDLQQCLKNAEKGLEKLKATYSYSYNKRYDEKFNTLIHSYARCSINRLSFAIDKPEIDMNLPIIKPKLIRQNGFLGKNIPL